MADDYANSSFYELTGVKPARQADYTAQFEAAEALLAQSTGTLAEAQAAAALVSSGVASVTTAVSNGITDIQAVKNTAVAEVSGIAATVTDNTTFVAPGGASRTLKARAGDRISVLDYALVDPTGLTDSSVGINAALSSGAKRVYAPAGTYLCTSTLIVPDGVTLEGDGPGGEWVLCIDGRAKVGGGTTILMSGTGAKAHTVWGISNMSVAGGVRSDSGGWTSSLLDLTNGNASGTTPATLKGLSVGVKLSRGFGGGLRGLRIVPDFGGVASYLSNYANASLSGLGSDWDIGVLNDNRAYPVMEDVQVVGYWRMAGLFQHNVTANADGQGSSEHCKYSRCLFQGYRGVALRGADTYRVTARTTNTIEVPYTTSHLFPSSGQVRVTTGTTFTYTGTSQTGDKFTFTGVTPDPVASGLAVGARMRLGLTTLGSAGTTFDTCYIGGLDHTSLVRAQGLGFTYPSACVEASGEQIRGFKFVNTTVQSQEDIGLLLHDCRDFLFHGSYLEGKTARTTVGGAANVPSGIRLVASTGVGSSTAAYPTGETYNLVLGVTTNSTVDRSPMLPRVTSRWATDGLFTPRDHVDEEAMFPAGNKRLNLKVPTGGRLVVLDSSGAEVISVSEDGTINLVGGSGTFKSINAVKLQSTGGAVTVDANAGSSVVLSSGGTSLVQAFATGNLSVLGGRLLVTDNATSGANGHIRYNASTHKFQGYANGSWVDFH